MMCVIGASQAAKCDINGWQPRLAVCVCVCDLKVFVEPCQEVDIKEKAHDFLLEERGDTALN